MPFRERLRNVFRPSSPGSSSPSNGSSTDHPTLDPSDPSVYQPGEVMPRPKYRRPVDKRHKKALENYSFGERVQDWRRRSADRLSLYSPGGSRLSSRNNSVSDQGGQGSQGQGFTGARRERDGHIVVAPGEMKSSERAVRQRGAMVRGMSRLEAVQSRESEGETHDVENVGISRVHSRVQSKETNPAPTDKADVDPRQHERDAELEGIDDTLPPQGANGTKPFTQAELNEAVKKLEGQAPVPVWT